jgi:hypothetical protein
VHGARAEPFAAEPVDEVLHVAAGDVGQLPRPERREHAEAKRLLVPPQRRRLVAVTGPVPDRAVAGTGEPRVGGLLDRHGRGRFELTASDSARSVLPPRLRRRVRREALADAPALPVAPHARAVGPRAVLGDADLDPLSHQRSTSSASSRTTGPSAPGTHDVSGRGQPVRVRRTRALIALAVPRPRRSGGAPGCVRPEAPSPTRVLACGMAMELSPPGPGPGCSSTAGPL